MFKKLTAFALLLCIVFSLTACSSILDRVKPGKKTEATEAVNDEHTIIHTLEDNDTTYYCWEDGTVTTKASYSESSVLFWENDFEKSAYVIKNSMGVIFVYSYAVQEEPTETTEPPTEATTADPYQGHTLAGMVIDSDMKITYYCWDDGTVTTENAYGASNMTWTQPWGQKFFNIYNGSSDNGNVLYSEKACTWCGSHKVFYLSYLRDSYDDSKRTEFLCNSCHVDLVTDYKKCSDCGYYTYSAYDYEGRLYCRYCLTN